LLSVVSGIAFFNDCQYQLFQAMAETSTKRKRLIIIALIVVVLIVGIRLALPYIILRYANNALAEMKGYNGHVEDIDLALLRGAYEIDSIYINKYDSASGEETPFFATRLIDLSIEWQSLLKGSLVGELVFHEPRLRFTAEKAEPDKIKKDSSDWKELLDDLMPLKVNRFEVRNGRIQYIDESSKPKVDISMTNTNILATNLRNAYDSSQSVLPAGINATADVYDGTLDFKMKLNPLADQPTFDLNAELKNTNLKKLNDFFQAYAKVDVNKGTFGAYSEVAAKDGKFSGYVKPILKDLDVLGKEDRKDNILRKLWEGFVGVTGQIFENKDKKQVATKIPFKGEIKDPDSNIWYTISQVMQNAFVRALQPSLDYEINLADVDAVEPKKKGFLERVFGKRDKDDKKDKDDKDKDDKKAKKDDDKDDKKSDRDEKKG
jgi:hypothetical protein